jgi:hypothetical protein
MDKKWLTNPEFPREKRKYIIFYKDLIKKNGQDPRLKINNQKRKILKEPLRISTGSLKTASDIFYAIPYSLDRERGGYITASSIYFSEGNGSSVITDDNDMVTFHTHPNSCAPSDTDIFTFLIDPMCRHIIIGFDSILIMTKTVQTLNVVENLYSWNSDNSEHAIKILSKWHQEKNELQNEYAKMALDKASGYKSSDSIDFQMMNLTNKLGIEVVVLYKKNNDLNPQ